MYWKYCVHEFQRFSVWCLQKEEALAEKIRAAFQRMRSRDLYDLYLFTEVPHDKDAVKTLVVIKCWNARVVFDPGTLLDKIVNAGQDWDNLQRLVRRGSLPSRDEVIPAVLNHYGFLENLDKQLIKVVIDSKAHRERKLVEKLVLDLSRQFGA